MGKLLRTIGALMLMGVLIIGCSKSGEKIGSVLILSSPQYDANFASNGRFTLSLVAITEDSVVIQIDNADDVEFEIDSVVPVGSFSIVVKSVGFVPPAADEVAIGLLLDSSGSMSSSDPSFIRVSASKTFINLLLADNASHMAAVADFGAYTSIPDDYYFRLLQGYTNVSNTTALFNALDSVQAGSGTPMYTGIRCDLDYTDSTVSSTSYSRALLILSDGDDNDSHPEDSLESVIALSQAKDIPLYTVGLGAYTNEYALMKLAQETGGAYVHADSAADLEAIYRAMGFGLAQGYTTTTGEFDPIPASGTRVFADVIISSGGQSASATIVFDIP